MLEFIKYMNQVLWGFPMLLILLGTHLFFTFRLGFIQKKVWKAIRLSVTPDSSSSALSGFGALTTTLAATLGTGNIVGVSTAIALGGPGAVFWCWLTGLFGMATSYAECYLSILFQKKEKTGKYYGGPMYVLEYGLHKKGMAVFYAVCTLAASFGVGCTTQSNSITDTTSTLWNLSPYPVGFITAIVAGLVIVGGIQSISKLCTRLVPAMGAFYLFSCFFLLWMNQSYLLEGLLCIVKSAFLPSSLAGGLIGGSLSHAARYGIARGLFTNEAGLGSAAIAAAGVHAENPCKQSLISMTATFWDTVVMCAVTGLVIVTNIIKLPASIQGYSAAGLTSAAFSSIPFFGESLLGISTLAFAIATLIGWSYFGEQAVLYLFGSRGIKPFQVCYIVMIFVGAVMSLELVWELTDFINLFMALPNLLALFLLRNKISVPPD